ncbi:unnamed protein product [Prunus armeniaca]
MLQKGSSALGSILINFLAWHERLVAWKQNQHEFSTEEEIMISWEKKGSVKVRKKRCENGLPEEEKWGRMVNSARNCWVLQKRPHFIATRNHLFPRNPNGILGAQGPLSRSCSVGGSIRG